MSRNPAFFFLLFLIALVLTTACETVSVLGRTVNFADQTWDIVESALPIGPGPNRFSSKNVSVDARGFLVLETREDGAGSTSASLFLSTSLGYGRYAIELEPIDGGLDDRTVFGFYTWDVDAAYANREIDIELSRWGMTDHPLLTFSVQPTVAMPEREAIFDLDPSAPIFLSFDWRPSELAFISLVAGRESRWTFPGAESRAVGDPPFIIPPRGHERVGLNLWLYEGVAPGRYDRVVVRSFSFTPFEP
ncbi:MAG: hypothetical protein ACOYM2_02085 [Rectinemataceae bacterium]